MVVGLEGAGQGGVEKWGGWKAREFTQVVKSGEN